VGEEAAGMSSGVIASRARPVASTSASLVRAPAFLRAMPSELREGLPTFMRVVQVHILDDAQKGPGMAREGLPFEGSRGMAPRPRWRPRSLIEISD
jgi:hypothetical protein